MHFFLIQYIGWIRLMGPENISQSNDVYLRMKPDTPFFHLKEEYKRIPESF